MTDEHGWDDWTHDGAEPDYPSGDTADLGGGLDDGGHFGADLPDHHDLPGHDLEPPDAGGYGEEHTGLGPDHQPLGYGDDAFVDSHDGEPGPDAAVEHDVPGPDDGGDHQPDDGTAGFGPAGDAPVGADPDLDPTADDPTWHEPAFPEPLDLGPTPEPVDGFPWTDPAVLGDAHATLPDPMAEAVAGAPGPDDLFAYAGEDVPAGGATWTTLAASPDPATSTLARFWAP